VGVVVVVVVVHGIEVEVSEGEFLVHSKPTEPAGTLSGGLVLDARTQKNHQCNKIRRETYGLPCQMPSTNILT